VSLSARRKENTPRSFPPSLSPWRSTGAGRCRRRRAGRGLLQGIQVTAGDKRHHMNRKPAALLPLLQDAPAFPCITATISSGAVPGRCTNGRSREPPRQTCKRRKSLAPFGSRRRHCHPQYKTLFCGFASHPSEIRLRVRPTMPYVLTPLAKTDISRVWRQTQLHDILLVHTHLS
jgi:hypothetical protein